MKINKGQVQYKDRNDIICSYCVTDDNRTYYFLDDNVFSNGNRIASTVLVEAIDPMVKSEHIGLIDAEGNEVIGFDNKGIKVINDNILLVEKSVPVTQSVIDAVNLRSDPLSAAKLVSTPAKIKDNIYSVMGTDGRFLFNDQFSEATLFDINGKNLVNNEVYSFIAMNGNNLYFSQNTSESTVLGFSIGEGNVITSLNTAPATPSVPTESAAVDNTVVNAPVENVVADNTVASAPVENVVADNTVANAPVENVAVDNTVVENAAPVVPAMPVVPESTEVNSDTSLSTDDVNVSNAEQHIDVTDVNVPVEVVENALEGVNNVVAIPVQNVVNDLAETNDISNDSLTSDAVDGVQMGNDVVSELSQLDNSMSAPEEVTNNEVANTPTVEDMNAVSSMTVPVVEEKEEKEEVNSENDITKDVIENSTVEEKNEDKIDETVEDEETVDEVVEDEENVDEVVEDEITEEENVVEEVKEKVENKKESKKEEKEEKNNEEEIITNIFDTPLDDLSGNEEDEVVEEAKEDKKVFEKDDALDKYIEDDFKSLFDEKSDDIFKSSGFKADRIDLDDDLFSLDNSDLIISNSKREVSGSSESPRNVYNEVAESMTSLMNQNRDLKGTIHSYKQSCNRLKEANSLLKERCVILDNQITDLRSRNSQVESAVIQCKNETEKVKIENEKTAVENDKLKGIISNQSSTINSLNKRIVELEKQLEGSSQFADLLKDVQAVLSDSGDYDMDESSYYRKVA